MHYSVLLNESIDGLNIIETGTYIDGTFGRGGHTSKILNKLTTGQVVAFDRDLEAITFADTVFSAEIESKKLTMVHAPFSTMKTELLTLGIGSIEGVLLDLGVSSPQIDQAERGFSFMLDGPLDMRMDQTKGESAFDVIHSHTDQQLANIFRQFGEERHAWRIACAIKQAITEEKELARTLQLANLIEKTIGKREKKHPATRCFQALRIYVNQELEEVLQTINDAFSLLKPGGRLAVISFHSLEDRIVKQFITALINGDQKHNMPRGIPIMDEFKPRAKWITKKGKARTQELSENTRSRSAILRIVEKLP